MQYNFWSFSKGISTKFSISHRFYRLKGKWKEDDVIQEELEYENLRCSLTLTRDVTTGLSKRPLRNNRSVSSATLPSSSRLSRTCMKAAGTVTRHFSITPCYLVVREGQRHCRHERRRQGAKRATRGGAGCGHSPDQYWDSHRWLEPETTRRFSILILQ